MRNDFILIILHTLRQKSFHDVASDVSHFTTSLTVYDYNERHFRDFDIENIAAAYRKLWFNQSVDYSILTLYI